MQNKNDYITMLGTGNALATRCYNTCFTLHGEKGVLLVDAGGGNGILTQLEKAGIRREDISDLFVTHAHTDHLLGCVWIMRMALQFRYSLRVWSHKKVLNLLSDICRQILPQKEADGIGNLVTMNCLEDGDQFEAGGFPLQCFDIHSTKERQFGFEAQLSDGRRLCCLGDEPFSTQCRQYAEGTDRPSVCMKTVTASNPTRNIIAQCSMPHVWQRNCKLRISSSIIRKTERSTLAARDIRWRRRRFLKDRSLYLMIWKE